MPQLPICGSKYVFIYQNDRWNVVVNSRYIQSGQKTISFGKTTPKDYMVKKTLVSVKNDP